MSRGPANCPVSSPTLVLFHQTYEGAQMNRIRNFIKSEEAIAVTEYGLLVALVAVLLIGVVTIFGSSIKSWFGARTATITTV
jgi:pilus assembly protein Flp/PilA